MIGMAPARTTVAQQLDGVKVTVEGVPAIRCQACGAISLEGKVMIPIDEAIEQILVAAGVASRPTPEEEAALRDENRALTRGAGQGDTLLPDSTDEPARLPTGAANTA